MRIVRRAGISGGCVAAALLGLPAGLFGAKAALLAQEGGSAIFSLNLGLVIWTWILFLLTLGLLAWKVFPLIAGGLEERQQKIQGAIDEARTSREDAERARDEARQLLESARREAQGYVEEGRTAAEGLRKEILAEAREQQKELLEDARRDIQIEREKLVEELRRESIEVSIAAAGQLLRARLDAEENRRLVRETMAQLQ